MHWKARKTRDEKAIAKERIEKLFEMAQESSDQSLSNRYVNLARKISMRLKVRIRSELKRRFCKHCRSYLRPGVNLRVRRGDGKMVYYCLSCKRFMRYPIKNTKHNS